MALTPIRTYLRQLVSISALAVLLMTASAGAADLSQPVTETYGTDNAVQQGMLVRLASDPSKVVPLESDRAGEMHGVVVAANDAALTLSSQASARQVYVATYGSYDVLVSSQNGAIKAGDYLTVSDLNGVAMKADGKQPLVLGKALEAFGGTGDVVGSASLKNAAGKSVEVSLGRIRTEIAISHNPLQVQSQSSGVTGLLQGISSGVAGKAVNPARLYLSMVILFLTAILAGSMLYSGIRNSIVSIGRNPLAKKSITRSLLQVIATSLIIFIIGIGGVYLLLRL